MDPSGVIRGWSTGAERSSATPPWTRPARRWIWSSRPTTATATGRATGKPWLPATATSTTGRSNVPVLHRDGTVMRIEVRLHVVHDSRNGVTCAMAVFSSDDDSAPPLERL